MEAAYNKSYEDLRVWQKAIEFVTKIYVITKRFPKDELFGLSSQIKRSSVSISANIAEGCGRNTLGEFLQFLGIASGSLAETHSLLIVARNVGILPQEDFSTLQPHIVDIGKMLNGLKKSLSSSTSNEQRATSDA